MDPVNVAAKFEVCSFTRSSDNSDWIFGRGLRTCEPPILGKRRPLGVRMVTLRALVISYRPSIVTFLYLYAFQRYCRFCAPARHFPPHLWSPRNFLMFPWELVDCLWASKSEGVGLIVRAISFQDFQPMWSWSTNVTDRRTDRRTDDMHSQYRALH